METRVTSHASESFWRRPLSKGVARIMVAVCLGSAILFEGWLGRKRLFVTHDRPYIAAFALFVASEVILLQSVKFVAEKARNVSTGESSWRFQVYYGVLSGFALVLFWIFSDYTLSSLSADSVVGSVLGGAIIGVMNSASMTKPTAAQNT